jgi:tetratricopeptide (TPR) repeat protein
VKIADESPARLILERRFDTLLYRKVVLSMPKRLLPVLFLLLGVAASAAAQDIEVDRYDISANIDLGASALDARAALEISNLGSSAKDRLYFRLTKLAKVTAATVNGAAARFDVVEDRRVPTLYQITITPSVSIAAGAKAKVEVSYRLEVLESTPTAAITSGEVLMTPEAVWFPMPSTMFAMYGATTAPFSLTVNNPPGAANLRAASAGTSKNDGGPSSTFEQPLNSLPFFVAGSFDRPLASERGGVKIEIWLQAGITYAADQKATAGALPSVVRLTDEAGRIIDFFTRSLGPPPVGASLRIISSSRTGNLAVPGALVLSEQVMRRKTVNAGTIELLADAIARLWIDGRVRLRGQESRSAQADRPGQKARSTALLRDSLPRYLAALYFEERFGADAAREAYRRMHASYTPIARTSRDAELGIQTLLSPTYGAAAFSKGPLVLRLLAQTGGADKFFTAIKSLLSGPQTKMVTLEDLRRELAKACGPEVDKLFQQWVDSIIEPDIVVGIPQPGSKPGFQRINLRNLGTGEFTVTLVAVTASGKKITSNASVLSEDLTSSEIQSDEKIASVEVDSEKLLIQTNYDNDARPARISAQTLLNDSIVAFNKGEYAEAEAKLRTAVQSTPQSAQLHAWLARALAAQKKTDEAANAASAALKIEPAAGSALAWASITLGEIALARNQTADAVQNLRNGLAEAEETPAQFAARDALVKAERAGGATPAVEESVRTFISQLDSLIKQPSSDRMFGLVVKNNLKRFVQGMTVTPPTEWTTEVLRVEPIDAGRLALDVGLKVKAGGRDQTGTAVFVLHRSGSGWMLEDVQHFNVK